jgi:tryptophan synthase alpha chain
VSRERLDDLFNRVRAEKRLAFLPYLTAGLPNPSESLSLFEAMEDADGFEVGIPYSDPLMDGPTVMAGGHRALAAGTTLQTALGIVSRIKESTDKPVVVMTYVNVVLATGPERFAWEAAAAGADGVIMADIPLEEALPLKPVLEKEGLGVVLFAAPTTPDSRLDEVAAQDPCFIYGVANLGVTGERSGESSLGTELASRVRARTDAPLVMGVGLSRKEQVAQLRGVADGAIIGSAIVRRVLEAENVGSARAELKRYTSEIARACRAD